MDVLNGGITNEIVIFPQAEGWRDQKGNRA